MPHFSLVALALLASACASDTEAPAAPTAAESAARNVAVADSSAAAYQTAVMSADGSAACAEATAAAASYKSAGREAEAMLWQNTAETACAALQPQIDATMARISDSLAAAK